MHIEAVEFSDFRNFHHLSFSPAPSLNILTGSNAQGKSNLLEGLGVLLVGRSFRGARAVELPRWDCVRAVLKGNLYRHEDVTELNRTVQPREDGVVAVMGDGCSWARAVPFSWQDMAVLHGGPQARRDFLDGFTGKLYPAHLTVHNRYRQVLFRRNRLLQDGMSAGLRRSLEPWNEQLVRIGIELLTRRWRAVTALQGEATQLYPKLAGYGQVGLRYESSLGDAPSEASFRDALESRFNDDARRGATLVGPHRDDLVIELDGRDIRRFGSRGQQRLMALTLRLAESGPVAEAVGSAPVLLLDDALSELDPRVQARVLEHIGSCGQVFLTTADAGVADAGVATRWEVQEGCVARGERVA